MYFLESCQIIDMDGDVWCRWPVNSWSADASAQPYTQRWGLWTTRHFFFKYEEIVETEKLFTGWLACVASISDCFRSEERQMKDKERDFHFWTGEKWNENYKPIFRPIFRAVFDPLLSPFVRLVVYSRAFHFGFFPTIWEPGTDYQAGYSRICSRISDKT